MKIMILKPIIIVLVLVFNSAGFAAINYNDGVPILAEDADPTDAQEDAIIEGSRIWCSDKPESQKEQCQLDYFVAHNYEGEPSCD